MIEERIQQQSPHSNWLLGKIVEVGAALGGVPSLVGAASAAARVRRAVRGKERTNAARLLAAAVAAFFVSRGAPRGTLRPPLRPDRF